MTRRTQQVLELLRVGSGFVSGQRICQCLGISRAAIWKHINILRDTGYAISSAPHRGYRLDSAPDLPLPAEIRRFLRTQLLGSAIDYRRSTSSTNLDAGHLASEGAPEGLLVVADSQTAGRGRMMRTWHSPPGRNLYLSLVLRPSVVPGQVPQLAIIAAVALVEALDAFLGGGADPGGSDHGWVRLGIKWPNDIHADARKLAGILCSMQAEPDRVRHVVLGLGLNVNMLSEEFPPELAGTATSLRILSGRKLSRPRLCSVFLNHFEPIYTTWQTEGLAPFLPALRKRSVLTGSRVRVEGLAGSVEGLVTGLGEDGALLLRTAAGTEQRVYAGDTHIISV